MKNEDFEAKRIAIRQNGKAGRTKSRIFDSAMKLMAKKGYDNITIRDICTSADVSIGTFYNYYTSKDDVFFDIYKPADDYFSENVTQEVLKTDDVKEKILIFFTLYAKLNVDTGLEITKILYNPSNSWFSQYRPMQTVLENIILTGQASGQISTENGARDLVQYLFVIARGCCYEWCLFDGKFDLEELMLRYIKLAVDSICK